MKIFNRILLLSLFFFTNCKTQFVATSTEKQLYKVTSTNQTDTLSEIEAYLKPFRDSLNITMNEVIGEAMGDFVKEKPSGSLGNLVVDAMLWQITNEQTQNSKFNEIIFSVIFSFYHENPVKSKRAFQINGKALFIFSILLNGHFNFPTCFLQGWVFFFFQKIIG